MKPLVVIPARGGSKGIPRKNIRLLAGKPLIHYTIEAARKVFADNLIFVSTDDVEIKLIAEQTGLAVPYLRPAELATDYAGSKDVLLHAVVFAEKNGYFPDTLILLQPTSPLRNATHIVEALKHFSHLTEMVVSVKETSSNPYYVLFEENEDGWLEKSKIGHFETRQQCPKVWEYNGAIYVINVATLREKRINDFTHIKKVIMDDQSSHDIDSELDWIIAEQILKNQSKIQ